MVFERRGGAGAGYKKREGSRPLQQSDGRSQAILYKGGIIRNAKRRDKRTQKRYIVKEVGNMVKII